MRKGIENLEIYTPPSPEGDLIDEQSLMESVLAIRTKSLQSISSSYSRTLFETVRNSPCYRRELTVDECNHLYLLEGLWREAVAVFNSEKIAMDWLTTHNSGLGNAVPIDLLDTAAGIELVGGSLNKIKYGIF